MAWSTDSFNEDRFGGFVESPLHERDQPQIPCADFKPRPDGVFGPMPALLDDFSISITAKLTGSGLSDYHFVYEYSGDAVGNNTEVSDLEYGVYSQCLKPGWWSCTYTFTRDGEFAGADDNDYANVDCVVMKIANPIDYTYDPGAARACMCFPPPDGSSRGYNNGGGIMGPGSPWPDAAGGGFESGAWGFSTLTPTPPYVGNVYFVRGDTRRMVCPWRLFVSITGMQPTGPFPDFNMPGYNCYFTIQGHRFRY